MHLDRLVLLTIIGCLVTIVGAFSQERSQSDFHLAPSVAIGANFPTGDELSQVFDYGYLGHVGLGLSVPRYNLILEPHISASYFLNKPAATTKDNLWLYGFGLDLQYSVFAFSNKTFLPFAGIDYLYGNNYLTPSGDVSGDKINLLKTNGLEYHFGLKFEVGSFGLKASFSLHNPDHKLDSGLVSLIPGSEYQSEIYGDIVNVSESPLGFNHLNLLLVYRLK